MDFMRDFLGEHDLVDIVEIENAPMIHHIPSPTQVLTEMAVGGDGEQVVVLEHEPYQFAVGPLIGALLVGLPFLEFFRSIE